MKPAASGCRRGGGRAFLIPVRTRPRIRRRTGIAAFLRQPPGWIRRALPAGHDHQGQRRHSRGYGFAAPRPSRGSVTSPRLACRLSFPRERDRDPFGARCAPGRQRDLLAPLFGVVDQRSLSSSVRRLPLESIEQRPSRWRACRSTRRSATRAGTGGLRTSRSGFRSFDDQPHTKLGQFRHSDSTRLIATPTASTSSICADGGTVRLTE